MLQEAGPIQMKNKVDIKNLNWKSWIKKSYYPISGVRYVDNVRPLTHVIDSFQLNSVEIHS